MNSIQVHEDGCGNGFDCLVALRAAFRHRLMLAVETSGMVLLGVLDLVLTFALLETGRAHEANPLARLCLFAGGLHGLIAYKFAMLTIATVSTQFVALRCPRTARSVYLLGIIIHALVIAYSGVLLARLA